MTNHEGLMSKEARMTKAFRRGERRVAAFGSGVEAHLAEDEVAIHKHAEISGFPATTITEVKGIIDPTTAA